MSVILSFEESAALNSGTVVKCLGVTALSGCLSHAASYVG